MSLNKVILYGRIVRDPEFKQTTNGTALCRFTVACDRQFANKQTGEREADFIDCQAWRNTAEFVSRYFSKGSAITVEGSLRNNNYEDSNGVKHFTYVVMVDNVGFGGDGKKDNQGGNSQPAQPTQRTQAAPARQNAAPSAQPAPSIQDLGEFEEILSNPEEVPF